MLGLGFLSQPVICEVKRGSIWKCTSHPASWICQGCASAASAVTKYQVQSYYGVAVITKAITAAAVYPEILGARIKPRSLPSAEEVHNCSLKAPSHSPAIKQNQQAPRKEKADANQNVVFILNSLLGTG